MDLPGRELTMSHMGALRYVDLEGRPFSGAIVTFKHLASGFVYETVADAQGEVVLKEGSPEGDYEVTISGAFVTKTTTRLTAEAMRSDNHPSKV